MHATQCDVLTERNAQVAWHHGKVHQLRWDPDSPQRLAVFPQLSPVLCIDVLWGAPLNESLHAVEHREVEEGMAAGHRTYNKGSHTHRYTVLQGMKAGAAYVLAQAVQGYTL